MGMLRIKLTRLLAAAGLCAASGGAVACYVAAVHWTNSMLYGPIEKTPPG